MVMLRVTGPDLCQLKIGKRGPHQFGGTANYHGDTPAGTDTPLQLMVRLDLSDKSCPIKAEEGLRYLPLFFPLKYGMGGPELQYEVLSDNRVKILYLSDPEPDPTGSQYVQVDVLPLANAQMRRLKYEEARAILVQRSYMKPQQGDAEILDALHQPHSMIRIGGDLPLPANASDIVCRNAGCKQFEKRVRVEVLAAIPPVPVSGDDAFWYEFQGGYVEFYFCLCPHCRTMIAFNVAS